MKKLFTLTLALVLTFLVCAACAQEMTVIRVNADGTKTRRTAEMYLETYQVHQASHEVCRENGDDYENAPEPEPLLIEVKDGCYVVYFRMEDPSDSSYWGARYFDADEVIIRLEKTMEPRFQEVSVEQRYRFVDTKKDTGRPRNRTMYLLTLPEDTRFE